MRALVLLALLALAAAVNLRLSTSTLPRKNLGGPASEFASKLLPLPSEAAVAEQSAMFKIKYTSASADAVCFSQALQVDGTESFAFSLFYSQEQLIHYKLYDPNSKEVSLQEHEYFGNFPIGDSGSYVPTATYWFDTPIIGLYTIAGECASTVSLPTAKEADMMIILWNSDHTKVYSRLSSYNLTEGQEIGLVATVFDDSIDTTWQKEKRTPSKMSRITNLGGTVMQAELVVSLPSGKKVSVPMHDDGLHNDEAANDGVYAALVSAAEVGTYQAQAFVRGFTAAGVQYIRSVQQLFRVVPSNLKLQNAAFAAAKADGTVDIMPVIDYISTAHEESYTAYAEVWGTAKDGTLVPVSWIGGAVDVTDYKGKKILPLVLNQKWLAAAGASEPLVLKNVYVQNQLIPVAEQATMVVKVSANHLLKTDMNVTEIDEEMYWGKRPARFARRNATLASTSKLVMVHGYCAANNPFEDNAVDFDDAMYFHNPGQSISNDAFAQKIAEFTKALDSFGLVAHSQGGLASTTLHNYYWSGLESAVGGRIIQSVGSPYGGSGMAGSQADLGEIFGLGCGSCYDLTHDGSALWVKGITSQAAASVYYYTTQYKDGGLVNYCNLGSNLLLKWPNDGVTELTYSVLAGAVSAGHAKAECHTAGMQWPAQCSSSTRDKEINSLAGR